MASRSTTSACCATARRSGSTSAAAGAKACCRRSRRCRPTSRRRHSLTTAPFAAPSPRSARRGAFAIPTARSRWSAALQALDAVTFARWLDAQGLTAPALRWYLDYCCRDDYGAGSAQVSAWAGLHYFASRHGFRAPGDELASDGGEGVLTWPEGNAWLAERLAAPLGERFHPGRVGARGRGRPRRRRRRCLECRAIAARALGREARRPGDAAVRLGAAARDAAAGAGRGDARAAPLALGRRQPAAARGARRSARRAAIVGQRDLSRPRSRLRRRHAPGDAAVRRARPFSPPTSRSAATAATSSSPTGAGSSATTGASGRRASSPSSRSPIPICRPRWRAST